MVVDEREVAITAGTGTADFGLPPIITVHFLDEPIGNIDEAGSAWAPRARSRCLTAKTYG